MAPGCNEWGDSRHDPPMDLASAWMLAFFGACALGGAVGFLLNKLVGFEFGLGVGLLIPGLVSLHFCWNFATE
jgi:hypothetical protein